MQLIVTHELADFDALAAAAAAQKLYPEAHIALGKNPGREVRDFLALHKERFRTLSGDDIDEQAVTLLVIVDVRRASRLAAVPGLLARIAAGDRALDVHVYDHHPASEDDVTGQFELIEPVGSATTLLVELVRRRHVSIDDVEATLFALGIHADTGSLTYANTTPRDAAALAWLLKQGARLDVVNRYLRPGFTREQRSALARLLGAMTTDWIGGLPIGHAAIEFDELPDSLADVTSEAAALGGQAALLAAYSMPGPKTQLIARSRSPLVDVGRLLSALGGGGHATAASAVVRGASGRVVIARLLEALRADPPRPLRVRDLMSSPVQTFAPDTPLSEIREQLDSRGHGGAPVLSEGKLVGIVTRSDVDRATSDARLHLPVSSCMRRDVLTATCDQSLEAALELMTRSDVGRLPIVLNGRLVGIVTRSDVLRALYGGQAHQG